MNTVSQKLPPKTVPSKITIKKVKTTQTDIEVYAEVLRDTTNSSIKGGDTTFNPVGALAGGNVFSIPAYSWVQKGGLKIIKKLNGPLEIKGTIKIQTSYGPKANPAHRSAYGRGTTPEDEESGNTSLGFHESCHRSDYLSYLKSQAFPTFGGKVGMTERQYKQAANSFVKSMEKYFEEMNKNSDRRTDEVGYKKSMYKTKGPRP